MERPFEKRSIYLLEMSIDSALLSSKDNFTKIELRLL